MAIVALQRIEAEAREQGQPLLDDLQDTMDALQGATEMRGTGERHIRLLPTKPIFEVSASPALLKAADVPNPSFLCLFASFGITVRLSALLCMHSCLSKNPDGVVAERHVVTLQQRATTQTTLAGRARPCTVATKALVEGGGVHTQVLDKQKPGKREESKQYRYPVTSSQSPDDAGWESEVYAREEELGAHEGRILAREFKQRLAYNIGQASQHSRRTLLHSSLSPSCFTCTGFAYLSWLGQRNGAAGQA